MVGKPNGADLGVHRPVTRVNQLSRAVFFDRDGIINERRPDDYVKTPAEFILLPDIFQLLPEVHRRGALAIVITNQRGIARGLMSSGDLQTIHDFMQDEVERRTGERFDAIYYCPHERDENCHCRKPRPGMLLDAARDHAIDLAASWMIGDTESDIEAGHAAGCRAALVAANEGRQSQADIVASSLIEVWQKIISLQSE